MYWNHNISLNEVIVTIGDIYLSSIIYNESLFNYTKHFEV